MNLVNFQKLLKDNLSVKCYLDFVPEKKTLPAVTYTHLANSAAKLLDGTKSGRSDTWRLSLVVDNEDQIQDIVNEVETLHNTKTDVYQRIFATLVNNEGQDNNEPQRRIIYDIQTFEG